MAILLRIARKYSDNAGMGIPVSAFLIFAFVLLFGTSNGLSLVGSKNGAWGYSRFPSATLQPAGNASIFYAGQKSDEDWQGGGLIYSPFALVELGATMHRLPESSTGTLSFKLQIPRMDAWQPLLSIGVMDLAMEQRRWEFLYFVGGYSLESEFMTMNIDIGAVYQRQETISTNRVTAFLASELDFGLAGLMLEMSRSSAGITMIPSLWLHPFQKAVYAGAGVEWSSGAPKSFPNLWGEAGVILPLGARLESSKNPWVILDFNPLFNHAFSATTRQYRVYLDAQAVLRTGLEGLFWVNGASLATIHSRDTIALLNRGAWDRSYALYSHEAEWGSSFKLRRPELGCGMFFEKSIGLFWNQEFRHRIWNPASIQLLGTRGNVHDYSAVLHLPLHPRGPSVLQWVQLYAEGGRYLFEGNQGYGGMRIGGKENYLDGAVGFDPERKQLLARVDLRMNLSRWTRWQTGPVLVRGFNRAEHRTLVYVQDLDADVFEPIAFANPLSQPAQMPWQPENWKEAKRIAPAATSKSKDSDLDGILDSHDACRDAAEDRDSFMDQDGCPDLDNDADRISDSRDQCPMESEDEDMFEDGDGCPELDNDKDGISDEMDACMNDAEDLDGFQDTDGCKDPDNDHDGIRDSEDACPNQAGLYTAERTHRGCPGGEDQDGIPFELDACPNAAEDYDGIQDTDGCPE